MIVRTPVAPVLRANRMYSLAVNVPPEIKATPMPFCVASARPPTWKRFTVTVPLLMFSAPKPLTFEPKTEIRIGGADRGKRQRAARDVDGAVRAGRVSYNENY